MGQFYFISPGNFDRPLVPFFFFKKRYLHKKLIQVIHDLIPLYFPKNATFWFRQFFRFILRRSLKKLTVVATVSFWTQRLLQERYPKSSTKIVPLYNGIHQIFGQQLRSNNKTHQELLKKQTLLNEGFKETEANALSQLYWVLGVGRDQPYKKWDLSLEVVSALQKMGIACIYVHLGNKPKAIEASQDAICFTGLSDAAMEVLYRGADVLLHPSLVEGFGLPVLEAALCGLPVVFRQSTAIADHFPPGSLPQSFWRPVSSDDASTWAQAVAFVLKGNDEKKALLQQFSMAPPREVIAKRLGVEALYDWQSSAKRFLTGIL